MANFMKWMAVTGRRTTREKAFAGLATTLLCGAGVASMSMDEEPFNPNGLWVFFQTSLC